MTDANPGVVERRRQPSVAASDGWMSRRLRAWWSALVGAIGVVVGLAPHVLHHVGLLLPRCRWRGRLRLFGVLVTSVSAASAAAAAFRTWWAPAIGLAVFAAMFSVTAFVIDGDQRRYRHRARAAVAGSTVDHGVHHGGG
jgi:hypothetical protein